MKKERMKGEDQSSLVKGYVLKNYTKYIYGHNVCKLLQYKREDSLSETQIAEYWGKMMEEQVIERLHECIGVDLIPCCTLTHESNRFVKSTPDAVIVKGWKRDVLVEVECPIFVTNMGKVKPAKYLQMQSHMYCGNKEECLFVQFYPTVCHFWMVKRNKLFYDKVLDYISRNQHMNPFDIQDSLAIDCLKIVSVTKNAIYDARMYEDMPWEELKINKGKLFEIKY
jgi:hypothetical protein